MSVEEIKKAVKEGKIIVGTKEVTKKLRTKGLTKVYITKNCPITVKETIIKYAKLSNVEVEEIKKANDELGTICKKPYSISVLGVTA